MGLALGQRPAGLAHRVLGDVREGARAGLRDPRRRHRSRLSPPRERDRPDRGCSRTPPGGDLDAQRHGPDRPGEDVQVGREHLPALRGHRSLRGETVVAYLASGHYRQPLAFSAERLEQTGAGIERIRNYLRDAPAGDPDPFLVEKRQAFLDALADDFNTPQAFAVLFEIVAEGNKRPLPGAREALTELLPLLGLDSLLEEEEAAPAEAERLLSE